MKRLYLIVSTILILFSTKLVFADNTPTFTDNEGINFSAIDGTTDPYLELPKGNDCSTVTSEGYQCWDADNDALYVGDGAAASLQGNPFGVSIDDDELTSEDFGDWTSDGTEDGCVVEAIQGVSVVDTAIETGFVLKYDGSNLIYTADVGIGDVTSVGDCTGGACLDGTSDGGTNIELYDGDSNKTTISTGNLSGDITMVLPPDDGDANEVLNTNGSGTTTWNTIQAGGYNAASIDGDDMNSNIAGRSLTLTGASPDTLDADPELYTDQAGFKDLAPEVGTLVNMFSFMNAVTITKVWCITDAGTVTINLEDGGDNDILDAELVCDADGQSSCAAGCDVDTIDATYDNITAVSEWVAVDTSAESGAADYTLYVGFTLDD